MMATLTSSVGTSFDVEKIRQDFPVLHQEVNGKPLAYFDNAATTQKPQVVLDALAHYYSRDNANIHRGIHTLAERATAAFEETREAVRAFLNAPSAEEIIFTRGTTEAINLVATSWGRTHLRAGDEVMISGMEHHSNIVPWQMVCEERGATLKVIPVLKDGSLDMEAFEVLLTPRVKMVAVVYVSNSLGTINPVKTLIDKAHAVGARVLLDGAQASSHLVIDVQSLDCDFYVFSGHKIYGPTGAGALFGKREVLEAMPPYQGGGEMIKEVTFEKTTYNDIPYKFEAGTPNIADVVAMRAAIDYLQALGKETLAAYEQELLAYATEAVQDIPGIALVGTAPEKISILSFVMEGIHHFDIGMMLDARGVAIRTGHHCTQPLMHHFGIEGTARASFAFYNTTTEVDRMVEGLHRIAKLKA